MSESGRVLNVRNALRELERPVTGFYVGGVIRSLRRAKGLTLVQLSEHSGLSVAFISQLENNRAKPSARSLAAIAESLGANVADITSAARAGSVADVERVAPTGLREIDRALAVFDDRVRVVEIVRPVGGGDGWHSHHGGAVLYVVRGEVSVFLRVDGGQRCERLSAGGRVLCGAGVPYRWQAESGPDDQAVVLAVCLDDPAVRRRVSR
ncbi:helix-turn-helix domain-containing protein [Mycolicibacterium sphagni]|uniref:Helix-turn-helix domain-containing protein n=1 Tax=Mycolicibacterium sphagni TaxID=1786 RepID=A0ABX2K3U0_9MYCO|nr:helix-turn-helix domain-containing protein [Mycolicibacterium sphagni]NTY63528.1 helix-turn-helix domain-containing protein [Mycolicibacterium sphagni]